MNSKTTTAPRIGDAIQEPLWVRWLLIGIAAIIAWCAVTSTIMFAALKAVGLLRVPAAAETGDMFIDAYEHGQTIMPDLLPLPGESASVNVPARGTAVAPAGD